MTNQPLLFWVFLAAQLLLWIYIASCFNKDVFFNLYVNRARTLLFKPVTFVQSIAPKCPDWVAAGILFIFTFLLHCAFAKASNNALSFRIGYNNLSANLKSLPASAIFSLMTFVVIVCQINIIRMVMMLRFGKWSKNAVIECLDTVCFPLSIPKLEVSAIATAVCLLGSTSLMSMAAAGVVGVTGTGDIAILPSLADKPILAVQFGLLAIVDILLLLKSAVVALVIVSIGGLVTGKLPIMGMANEWLSAFSRIFIKKPLTLGMFDLTPLLIYYLAEYIHAFLANLINGMF